MKNKRAYRRDILRTIIRGKGRFLSILIITALGVVMFAGLRASCVDLRLSADSFMDEQNLYDICVQSTLGLTEEDVEALSALEGVSEAEGGYSETVNLSGETHETVAMKVISDAGMSMPYVEEGRLPETADEVAVTQHFITASEKNIGDTVTIEEIFDEEEDEDTEDGDEAEDPTFANTEYTITGIVVDAADINNTDETTSYRNTSTTDYTFFVTWDAVDSDVYTAVYLTVDGAAELNCYSDAYDAAVSEVMDRIEQELKSEREEARTESIRSDAQEEIDDARTEMEEAFAEADEEFADAEAELADARDELDDGWEAYYDGLKEYKEGLKEYNDGVKDLEDGQDELDEGAEELKEQEEETMAQLEDALEEIDANISQLEALLSSYSAGSLNAQGAENLGAADDSSQIIEDPVTTLAQLKETRAELKTQQAKAKKEFAAAWEKIEKNQAKLDKAEKKLKKAKKQLTEAKTELAEAKAELTKGETEYADGVEELAEEKEKYEEEKADAEAEIADAEAELSDLEEATWYIQDRGSLSGYNNVASDSGAIESIGTIFPGIFLAVAILVCLTTFTRMVEEERSLIGTYKALGYSNGSIRRKYMIYAMSACICGCIVGEIGGFIILPKVIFIIFGEMYAIPSFGFSFDVAFGLAGPAIFLVGVGLATGLACRVAIRQRPAVLMRPKAPRAGSRVFLERIPVFWKRLSFLNKVTVRNLFRYKKRLLMTIVGIMGCTSLIMCAFAIRDMVSGLMNGQYGEIYKYDLMAVADDNDAMVSYMDESDDVESYLNVRIDSVTVEYDGSKETVQLIVVPDADAETLETYIHLETAEGETIVPADGGILITRNAGQMLGFANGDTVKIQDLTLAECEAEVTALMQNYMGNNIYMTQSMYEEVFGEYEANGAFVLLDEDCDAIAWTEELTHEDGITSATSVAQLREDFSQAFVLINMVVYVLLVLAAALAFVVLFTLSSTNISEREREMATIKVLGFYDREVHQYLNKETIILTIIGIIPGLVLGTLFGHSMTYLLKMPSIYFAVDIHPVSYLYSGGISFIFALLVLQITNRILNAIDPVNALKSVE